MSNKTVVYDSEFLTVEYWPDKRLIYHVIHQPLGNQVEIFKEALNAGSDTLAAQGVSKWLSDDRKNGPLTPEGNEWAFNVWHPKTIKAGWKYWAAVVPEDLAAAGTLLPIIDNLYQLGLRMMVFTDTESAIKWLDKMG